MLQCCTGMFLISCISVYVVFLSPICTFFTACVCVFLKSPIECYIFNSPILYSFSLCRFFYNAKIVVLLFGIFGIFPLLYHKRKSLICFHHNILVRLLLNSYVTNFNALITTVLIDERDSYFIHIFINSFYEKLLKQLLINTYYEYLIATVTDDQ